MSDEKTFVKGMIVKRHERAPDFVLCNLSIKVDELAAFMQQHQSNGWLNVQCKVAKSGKMYAELDTWKPTDGDAAKAGVSQARQAAGGNSAPQESGAYADFEDDIPFSNYEYRGWA
jgi:hypothetical protein